MRVGWKGAAEHDTRHLPMAGGRVLAWRKQGTLAIGAFRPFGRDKTRERSNIRESQANQMG